MNGFYRFEYLGHHSPGMSNFVLADGRLFGTDGFGGNFKGTYSAQNGFSGQLELSMPTGGRLITGRLMGPDDVLPIRVAVPADALEGAPFRLDIDGTDVMVRMTRISGL